MLRRHLFCLPRDLPLAIKSLLNTQLQVHSHSFCRKAKKLSLQIPTHMVSDWLEIVHHQTLIWFGTGRIAKKTKMKGTGQLSFLYLKKNDWSLVRMLCAWVQVRAYTLWRLMDFWLQMFYQDNPPCSHLQRRLCGSIKSAICFLKVTKYAFSQQRQVISLLEPTEFVTQLHRLFKASLQKAKEMSWLWSGQKALKSQCRLFLLLWHRKEWTDTMNK